MCRKAVLNFSKTFWFQQFLRSELRVRSRGFQPWGNLLRRSPVPQPCHVENP